MLCVIVITFGDIDEQFVYKNLRDQKTNKAIGFDRVSARLLKDSANVLTNLFNRSLSSSIYPDIWKCGKVTALFKSGERSDPNNYRPITVLPIVSKLLEKAAHSHITIYRVINYCRHLNLVLDQKARLRLPLSTSLTQFWKTWTEDFSQG